MRTNRFLLLLPAVVLAACGPDASFTAFDDTADPEVTAEAELGFAGDPANNALYSVDVSMWEGPIAQHSMDCLWDSNVRHVVAGTQVEEITRQQLGMARARGMSLDAYVYLYWDRDMAAQVQTAFDRVTGFNIGRLWLDVEEAPAGRSAQTLIGLVQQAVDACRAKAPAGVTCGIYTGPGFWRSYMANTTRFADVPLWYAQYNDVTSLSAWSTEKFGGWAAPAAKQWAERVLCGIGLDRNTMQVVSQPAVVVDRTPAPRPTAVPPAPTGLAPSGKTGLDYVLMMAATIPYATQWSFSVESWDGTKWSTYATWNGTNPSRKFFPYWKNRIYRFRARAQNGYGWGSWSDYQQLEVGTWTGTRPGGEPPPQPPPQPPQPPQPPPQPPPVAGAPTGLTPDGGTVLTSSSVTMSCAAVTGATSYEFAIEYLVSGAWKTYYTYAPTLPRQTFYPQSKTSYRFTVRAKVNGTFTPKSNAATFEVR